MIEIVAGDFGTPKLITAPGVDLSLCEAKIKVWKGSTILIDYKACGTVTFDSDKNESSCYFTPADGDFPLSAAIDDEVTVYEVMVKFFKTGFQEHCLKFEWTVHPAPPPSPP